MHYVYKCMFYVYITRILGVLIHFFSVVTVYQGLIGLIIISFELLLYGINLQKTTQP